MIVYQWGRVIEMCAFVVELLGTFLVCGVKIQWHFVSVSKVWHSRIAFIFLNIFVFCCCVQAFNPDNEYHFKNRMKLCQRNWVDVFGEETNMFAVSPSNTYQKVGDSPFIYTIYYGLFFLPLPSAVLECMCQLI